MCLAVPGKIIEIIKNDPLELLAKVSFGGVLREVNITLVPKAQINDYVIVHAGMAISKMNENEAQEVFSYLEQIINFKESEQ